MTEKGENTQIMEKKEEPYEFKVIPKYTAWREGDKIIINVAIPGVPRDKIEMKALKDRFLMRAKRDNIIYDLDLDLSQEIEPEKTKAEYNEGLLRVELKCHNPLDDAYDVPIE